MERSKLMMVMAAVAFSLLVIVPRADATRYIVGGKMGWTNNVNYTAWAQGIHFYDGDWLFFVYDRDLMNVLEVNKTDYESCNADHPLGNWTTGAGRDVVPLNVTRYYYFISGKGFCNEGMKVAVRVENPPPPPKASPPLNEKSGFPSSFHRSHLVSPPAVSPIGAPWDVKSQSPSPTASALKEKSGSPSSIYGGQLVSPAVLAIGALWGAFVRAW